MTTTSADLDARIADETLATRFLENLDKNPDVAVLRWKDSDGEWQSSTLGEMADTVARLVTAFRGLGLQKGDRVVLMMRNRPEFHPIDVAVLFCGGVAYFRRVESSFADIV